MKSRGRRAGIHEIRSTGGVVSGRDYGPEMCVRPEARSIQAEAGVRACSPTRPAMPSARCGVTGLTEVLARSQC
jgi:hypothetical protein